jgi:hypothetical protein
MAGANPSQAEVLLVSATWNGTRLGVVVGFSYEEALQDVVIRGEGVTGPSCRSPVARDMVATLSFLVGPPIDPIAFGCTAGELDIVVQLADCVTQIDRKIFNTLPRGFSHSGNRDAPPFIWTQSFAIESDMTSEGSVTTDTVVVVS